MLVPEMGGGEGLGGIILGGGGGESVKPEDYGVNRPNWLRCFVASLQIIRRFSRV